MKAFTIMGRVLKATWDELFLVGTVSLLWWLGQLLVLTAAPATMGVQHIGHRVANYRRVGIDFFWEGAKSNIGKGWLLYLASLLAPFALVVNVYFWGNAQGWVTLLSVFWLWVSVIWLMLGQYLFPLLWQQDEPSLKLAFRNAALLAVRYPLYSFLMVAFQLLLMGLSIVTAIPLFFLLPGMIALSGNLALVGALQEMGLAAPPPESAPRR